MISRRRCLTALGLGTAGLWLPSRVTRAQGVSPPRRLLVFFTAHGATYPSWRMRPGGQDDDTAFDEPLAVLSADAFSAALLPLHPWRSRLTVVDGLSLASAAVDSGFEHEIGAVHALTGAASVARDGVAVAASPSIDQLIAAVIGHPQQFRSLELAVGRWDTQSSYAIGGVGLPAEHDPQRLWSRLFGVAPGSGQTSDDVILGRQRPSILDAVADRYVALAARLSAADGAKLAQHAQLVRDLEVRLSGLASATCPEAPGMPGAPASHADFDEATFEAQVHNLVAAFSCDLTRVATLRAAQQAAVDLGEPPGDVHDEHAHNVMDSPAAFELLSLHTTRHMGHLARILELLDAVPEGDGTLLDTTTVVWMSEMANSVHGFDQWPVVVAGGDAVRLGRYLRFPRTTPIPVPAFSSWAGEVAHMGVPHQRFLNTLAEGFGVESAVGETEIMSPTGEAVDTSGVLAGLVR